MVGTNPAKLDEEAIEVEGGREMTMGEVTVEALEVIIVMVATGVEIIIKIMIMQVKV